MSTRSNLLLRRNRHWKSYTKAQRAVMEWQRKADRSYAQWAKADDELYDYDKENS